jgi:hypothetical protein
LQRGTSACLNVFVPQTGKAVEGFWPGVVQVCALAAQQSKKVRKRKLIFFSISSDTVKISAKPH